MSQWTFSIAIISVNNFLIGFHYRSGEITENDGTVKQMEIHELGLGIIILSFERYK